MVNTIKLPVGIDSFEKIRKYDFYYLDKTKLIEQILKNWSEVSLFTRPRRFGKTLNMSMLRAFFEIGTDSSLFDGLYISQNKELCQEHMGKYPVIFLSLKSVEGLKFADARYRIIELIGREAQRFEFLAESDRLSNNEKAQYDEAFGFTDGEVKQILKDYNLSDHYSEVKEWYDGYHFGNTDIYCPWDVVRYCKSLCADPTALPEDFWSNSSGNAIVRRLIDRADVQTKNEIERLIAGESVEREISQELTYDELDKNIENLWSVLFTTGYLTHQGRTEDDKYRLVIPNKEIRNLFIKKIREWFSDASRRDGKTLEEFCNAFVNKDTLKIEQLFGDYLWNTISIRDTATAKVRKENFYHGILLGLLGYKASWLIKSNAESGTGYSDILVEVPDNRTGIVIELKYAEDGDMDAACSKALEQIEEKEYVAKLKQDGMRNFIKYGIACFKKDCKVVMGNNITK